MDPIIHFTILETSGHNGLHRQCIFTNIQTQIRLSLVAVHPVTVETILGKNGANIPIKVQGFSDYW